MIKNLEKKKILENEWKDAYLIIHGKSYESCSIYKKDIKNIYAYYELGSKNKPGIYAGSHVEPKECWVPFF